jgi:tRNA dimethylallyltransferase
MKKWLVVIHGPTASGKTSIAIRLALHYQTEIISADSRQFYKELNIGVARPSADELAAVKHHFIAFLSVQEPYSAGRFEQDALATLHDLFQTHDIVIAAGGSGLYARALIHGLDDLPSDAAVRNELNAQFEQHGIAPLREELLRVDPDYYHHADTSNHRRVIRALEVCRITGNAYSSLRKQASGSREFGVLQLGLKADREWLYPRINQRVDEMVRMGLEQEAKTVYPHRALPALQTVGYTEWFQCFDGLIDSATAIGLIKQHSRNYAKRQMTWYRSQPDILWFDAKKGEQMLPETIAMIDRNTGIAQ